MDPEGVGEFSGEGGGEERVVGEVDTDLMGKLCEYLTRGFYWAVDGVGGGYLPKRTYRREAR